MDSHLYAIFHADTLGSYMAEEKVARLMCVSQLLKNIENNVGWSARRPTIKFPILRYFCDIIFIVFRYVYDRKFIREKISRIQN